MFRILGDGELVFLIGQKVRTLEHYEQGTKRKASVTTFPGDLLARIEDQCRLSRATVPSDKKGASGDLTLAVTAQFVAKEAYGVRADKERRIGGIN